MKAQNQLNDETMIDDSFFTLNGNISPIINHGIGPRPNENEMMKNMRKKLIVFTN